MYSNPFNKTKKINYGNRGMTLEKDLNETNNYYLVNDIAVIYKKPTPIEVNKVDYKSRKDAVITKALYKIPSTTDYNGIYKGYYIDFEAKETTSTTSFPLSNIHKHQIEHMKRIVNHGGISFVIVSFSRLNQVYLLETKKIIKYMNETDKKSIPIQYFKENGYHVKYGFNPRIDYLKIVDFFER